MPTIEALDTALVTLLSGATVPGLTSSPSTVPVAVILGQPDPALVPERRYPAISISWISQEVDQKLLDSDINSGSIYRESYVEGEGDLPGVSTRKPLPEWYSVMYRVSAWTLDSISDRTLVRWVDSKVRSHMTLAVGAEKFWLFKRGQHRVNVADGDRTVYRVIWDLTIRTYLDQDMEVSTAKIVKEIHFDLYKVKRTFDSQGKTLSASESTKAKVSSFAFDSESSWKLP